MRRALLAIAVTAAVLSAPVAHAAPATCTVTDLDVAGTFPFNNIGGVGLVIPLDIEGGRIVMQRDAFTGPYPSPGLEFATGFGPSGWLDWDPGPIEGTIDGNGHVVFTHFGMRFFTDFGDDRRGGPGGRHRRDVLERHPGARRERPLVPVLRRAAGRRDRAPGGDRLHQLSAAAPDRMRDELPDRARAGYSRRCRPARRWPS